MKGFCAHIFDANMGKRKERKNGMMPIVGLPFTRPCIFPSLPVKGFTCLNTLGQLSFHLQSFSELNNKQFGELCGIRNL